MSNPIFDALGGGSMGNIGQLVQQFQQFRKSFTGDARQQVQQMLNSGAVSQQEYNQAVQMANAMSKMLGGRF